MEPHPLPPVKEDSSSSLPYGIAVVAGAVLWFATAAIGGKTEPWDTSIYWTVAYPAAIVLAGVLGYAFPQRPWRWAVAAVAMQVPVMVMGGSGLGLLPLGLVVIGVLSLPGIALARWAAKIRVRRQRP